MNISNANISLSDFLSQKTFKFSDIKKSDIEIIKRISSIKLSKDINILDLYRKKKDLFFKAVSLSFDLLKNKILTDEENKKKNLLNDKPEFLRITKPGTDLLVNFNEINIYKFGSLVNYQIFNILPKLQKITIITSDAYLLLLYSLVIYCRNLTSLKITLTCEFDSGNTILDIYNDTLPILFTHLKNLTEFSFENIQLKTKKIGYIVNSIKTTSIKKLSLINCFSSKEDLSLFNPYFMNPNCLTEINLSKNDFNVPTLLSSSLLNYSINKNLTSLNFSKCLLNKDDIQYISNYIVESPIILSCNLGKNPLNTLACSTFAYAIQKTKSLEELILNDCCINGESLLFLFNKKGSQTLKHINISGNIIGDIGLVSIGAFIKNSKKLKILELKKCGGTDMGFKSIVETLHLNDNNTLEQIHFQNNKISSATFEMMKKLNDIFVAKKVVFYLDKIEGGYKMDCVKFNKS
jgi:Ran GTPase-activating protein (RanGAP) involved in mRNA processing and transport